MSDRLDKSRIQLGQRIATYRGVRQSPLWLVWPALASAGAWSLGLAGWFSEPVNRVLLVIGFCTLAFTLIAIQRFRTRRKWISTKKA